MIDRVLAEFRARGEPVPVAELAGRIVAARSPLASGLARRLVATVLDWEGEPPGDVLQPDDLRDAVSRSVAGERIDTAAFLVVDLETTGLGAEQAEIVEIGAVRIERLALCDEFSTFVQPSGGIPELITRLTGIDDRAVMGAPQLGEALQRFRLFAAGSRRPSFVAHNSGFDAGFLEVGLDRCGLPPLGMPIFCTRRLGRRLAPEIGRYDLDHISAHFGVSNAARHRALGDARATARVWIELLERARAQGLGEIFDLIDLQARPPEPRRRRRTRSARRPRR